MNQQYNIHSNHMLAMSRPYGRQREPTSSPSRNQKFDQSRSLSTAYRVSKVKTSPSHGVEDISYGPDPTGYYSKVNDDGDRSSSPESIASDTRIHDGTDSSVSLSTTSGTGGVSVIPGRRGRPSHISQTEQSSDFLNRTSPSDGYSERLAVLKAKEDERRQYEYLAKAMKENMPRRAVLNNSQSKGMWSGILSSDSEESQADQRLRHRTGRLSEMPPAVPASHSGNHEEPVPEPLAVFERRMFDNSKITFSFDSDLPRVFSNQGPFVRAKTTAPYIASIQRHHGTQLPTESLPNIAVVHQTISKDNTAGTDVQSAVLFAHMGKKLAQRANFGM